MKRLLILASLLIACSQSIALLTMESTNGQPYSYFVLNYQEESGKIYEDFYRIESNFELNENKVVITEADLQRVKDGVLWIGMTARMAEKSIGPPDDIIREPRLATLGDVEHWVFAGTRKVVSNPNEISIIKVVLDWNKKLGLPTDTPTLQISFENNILKNWEY